MTNVETLGIKIDLINSTVKAKAEETKKLFKGISSSIDNAKESVKDIKKAFASGWRNDDSAKMTKAYKNVQDAIKKTTSQLDYLYAKQARLGSATVQTDEYKKVQKEIASLEKEIEKFERKQKGLNIYSEEYGELQKSIDNSRGALEKMRATAEKMDESGTAYKKSEQWHTLQKQIKAAEAAISGYKDKEKELISENKAFEYPKTFGDRLKGLGAKVKGFASNALSSFRDTGKSATMSLGRILRYAVGIRTLFAAFGKIKSYAKEGFGNLAQYSSQTRSDLARLQGSLTQVKNSLAVAFAPIVTAIAPYVQTLVNLITTACNALAQFFGALTGQKTVTIAKSGLGDISAGASNAAGATNAANDAAKEYQRTLMGFDQINKLDDNSGSGSGSGSGGSGGGVGGAAGFTTTEIDNVYSGWAEKMKEAWANADFTEIGAAVADKINAALESINWDKIKSTCNKVAKSIGTFINGFVEELDWGLVGNTISQGFITAFDAVSTFVETVNWSSLGRAVVQAIAGIDWAGLFSSASRLAGSIVGGIASFLGGLISEAFTHIKEYFSDSIDQAGGDVVQGIFDGIKNGIKNIGTWIKTNIFQPFLDGFKAAFRISSPSKVMEDQGGYIISGLLDGLKNNIGSVIDWFKNLPSMIKEKVGEIVVNVSAKITEWKDDIKEKVMDFKANITDKVDSIKSKLLDFKANLIDRVKDSKFSSTIGGMIASFKSKEKGKGFSSTLGNMIAKFTDKVNGLTKNQKKLSMTANITSVSYSGKNKIKVAGGYLETKAGGGLFMYGRWKPITAAANGGSFSTGQMFVARERGPEMVGTIGRHSAVVNNGQIVSSISDGVYRAVSAAMSGNGKEVNVNITLEGESRNLFRVIRKEAVNYTNSTGLAAFPV